MLTPPILTAGGVPRRQAPAGSAAPSSCSASAAVRVAGGGATWVVAGVAALGVLATVGLVGPRLRRSPARGLASASGD
ncbi:hypothetical protein SK069_08200 [Patulibacter brassicae]|uniref:Uncharacterized protein n=1 Tax=Patulibacter brassicae TaxID=1705717 RepID=A0ABU4VIG3_9ACTN|nr:hypothetical protein [Patulibacter brassicae]MDX8151568.1 hypothetical protein [Patulibacter brassicae]